MAELTHIDEGLAVIKREGTYHARIRVDGKYVTRSLKTGDLSVAIKAAQKLKFKFDYNAELGIPNDIKTLNTVIDEYLTYRRKVSTAEQNQVNGRRKCRPLVAQA